MDENISSCFDMRGSILSVGDQFTREHGGYKGRVFTVSRITSNSYESGFMVWAKEDGLWTGSKHVALAAKAAPVAKRFIIIAENASGKLAPAITPREYASREQAEKVALTMAETHDTKMFVFESSTYASPPPKASAKLVNL